MPNKSPCKNRLQDSPEESRTSGSPGFLPVWRWINMTPRQTNLLTGRLLLLALAFLPAGHFLASPTVRASERMKVEITSTIDGTKQPCYVILPDGYDPAGEPTPLLVSLHTFSGGVEQRQKAFEAEANKAGWIYLFPHFRGPQQNPTSLRVVACPARHP